jgi:hypothetical protein
MIIKKKKPKHIEIDLDGPQGNAYTLLGIAKQLCAALDKDYEDVSKRMKAGNYNNLIQVFEEEFSDFVTMYKGDW